MKAIKKRSKKKKKVLLKKEVEPADEVVTEVEEQPEPAAEEGEPRKIQTRRKVAKRVPESEPSDEYEEGTEEASEKRARPDVIFKFYCTYCGQPLAASEAEVGECTDCPTCEQRITIPEKISVAKNLEAWQPASSGAEGTYKFYCPSCEQKLGVKYSLGGKKIKCPSCDTKIHVPELVHA